RGRSTRGSCRGWIPCRHVAKDRPPCRQGQWGDDDMSTHVPFEYAAAPLPTELTRHYASLGFQSSVTPGALMLRNQREFGRLPAVFDDETALTWHELIDRAARFGGYLRAQGIGPGDVVMWQLPNWWECLVTAY